MRCTKMNGNGNDFIVIDNMTLARGRDELSRLARALCRRGLSVGADGLLAAEPSDRADFKMRLFNSDGSEGEMCGNGVRCIARYAFEKGLVKSRSMRIDTLGGEVLARAGDGSASVELEPVSFDDIRRSSLSAGGRVFDYSYLTVGVPHTVIFEEKHEFLFGEYAALGREIRNMTELFPHGTNVNFAVVTGDGLDVFTYERGVEDMTLSCGTGSAASVIAAFALSLAGNKVRVQNPGGVNSVTLELSSDGRAARPVIEGNMRMTAELDVLPDALL